MWVLMTSTRPNESPSIHDAVAYQAGDEDDLAIGAYFAGRAGLSPLRRTMMIFGFSPMRSTSAMPEASTRLERRGKP